MSVLFSDVVIEKLGSFGANILCYENSALGRFDGKVYEDLFHRAHVINPLNELVVNPDYHNDEIELGSGDGGKILAKL